MRVLFLGDTFPAAREMLAGLLPNDRIDTAVPASSDALGSMDPADVVDVLVPAMEPVTAAVMDAARPRLIQQFGAGVEGVDLTAAAARDIPVANVPADATGNASSVAELAVLHLLALSRRLDAARAAVRDGRLGQPMGHTLAGKVVVVVGLGAIGRELIPRLRAFGLRIIGVARRPADQLDPGLAELLDGYHPVDELRTALSGSDALVLCAPLTVETHDLVGADGLAALNPGAVVVNVGRGGLLDRDALHDALRSGHVAGAGLDVFWHEPADPNDALLHEHVLLTPHIGGVTQEAYQATAVAFAENVERLRSGDPPLHRVG